MSCTTDVPDDKLSL